MQVEHHLPRYGVPPPVKVGVRQRKIIEMKIQACLATACLLLAGCGSGPKDSNVNAFGVWHEYELDSHAFDTNTMQMIRNRTGLNLPPDVIGLNYHHYPPIDPAFAARIEIPEKSKSEVLGLVSTVQANAPHFRVDLGERNHWWISSNATIKLSRKYVGPEYLLRATLADEDSRTFLYIEYGVK